MEISMSHDVAGSVLILGGGIAGLTAAQELARMRVGVHLIEKDPFIGGHAANLTCKATDRCIKCNHCLVEASKGDFSKRWIRDQIANRG